MKCLFLTIFLDCSWLWKQGLKSFFSCSPGPTAQWNVHLLLGIVYDSLCWYPYFWLQSSCWINCGIWDGMARCHRGRPWSSLTRSLAGRHSRCPWLAVTHAVLGLACSSLWLVLMAQEARSSSSYIWPRLLSSYFPCLRPSCYLCDGLGSHNMFWQC